MSIYERLGVKTVINAAGNYTTLGGSLMPKEVVDAMASAAQSYVVIEDLLESVGDIIAELTGAEAGFVTSGAAAGLALAVAACMTGIDLEKMKKLPKTEGMRNEVIVQKVQRCIWDRYLTVTGARIVEVGGPKGAESSDFDDAINEKTAAITYFAHIEESALPLEELVSVASKRGIPVIVDAAAEIPPVENLRKYIDMGADLVVISGGKGIEGPQPTGLIYGRKDLIEAISLQANPNLGIGRPMKVGKEEIVGLIVALERFVKRDWKAVYREWENRSNFIFKELSELDNIDIKITHPERGARPPIVPRIQLSMKEGSNISIADFIQKLRSGEPSIEVEHYAELGEKLHLSPQCLQDGEERVIVEKIRKIISNDN